MRKIVEQISKVGRFFVLVNKYKLTAKRATKYKNCRTSIPAW